MNIAKTKREKQQTEDSSAKHADAD